MLKSELPTWDRVRAAVRRLLNIRTDTVRVHDPATDGQCGFRNTKMEYIWPGAKVAPAVKLTLIQGGKIGKPAVFDRRKAKPINKVKK